MATYSFLDVNAAIVGPGGAFIIGQGAGASEEGISYAMSEDKNTMLIGADGSPMHSLHATKGGIITVRLLKTSIYNAFLQAMYNLQTLSASLHGQNTIVVSDTARGDVISGRLCAFKKSPDNQYAKDGNVLEWGFDVGYLDPLLGQGVPDVNT